MVGDEFYYNHFWNKLLCIDVALCCDYCLYKCWLSWFLDIHCFAQLWIIFKVSWIRNTEVLNKSWSISLDKAATINLRLFSLNKASTIFKQFIYSCTDAFCHFDRLPNRIIYRKTVRGMVKPNLCPSLWLKVNDTIYFLY